MLSKKSWNPWILVIFLVMVFRVHFGPQVNKPTLLLMFILSTSKFESFFIFICKALKLHIYLLSELPLSNKIKTAKNLMDNVVKPVSLAALHFEKFRKFLVGLNGLLRKLASFRPNSPDPNSYMSFEFLYICFTRAGKSV